MCDPLQYKSSSPRSCRDAMHSKHHVLFSVCYLGLLPCHDGGNSDLLQSNASRMTGPLASRVRERRWVSRSGRRVPGSDVGTRQPVGPCMSAAGGILRRHRESSDRAGSAAGRTPRPVSPAQSRIPGDETPLKLYRHTCAGMACMVRPATVCAASRFCFVPV